MVAPPHALFVACLVRGGGYGVRQRLVVPVVAEYRPRAAGRSRSRGFHYRFFWGLVLRRPDVGPSRGVAVAWGRRYWAALSVPPRRARGGRRSEVPRKVRRRGGVDFGPRSGPWIGGFSVSEKGALEMPGAWCAAAAGAALRWARHIRVPRFEDGLGVQGATRVKMERGAALVLPLSAARVYTARTASRTQRLRLVQPVVVVRCARASHH